MFSKICLFFLISLIVCHLAQCYNGNTGQCIEVEVSNPKVICSLYLNQMKP